MIGEYFHHDISIGLSLIIVVSILVCGIVISYITIYKQSNVTNSNANSNTGSWIPKWNDVVKWCSFSSNYNKRPTSPKNTYNNNYVYPVSPIDVNIIYQHTSIVNTTKPDSAIV